MRTTYRRAMSLAQKTRHDRSAYGRGFNYWVEITFAGAHPAEKMDAVLKRLDHKHVGLDLHLGFEPSTARLAQWLAANIKGPVFEVRLERGDGYTVTYSQPGAGIGSPDRVKG